MDAVSPSPNPTLKEYHTSVPRSSPATQLACVSNFCCITWHRSLHRVIPPMRPFEGSNSTDELPSIHTGYRRLPFPPSLQSTACDQILGPIKNVFVHVSPSLSYISFFHFFVLNLVFSLWVVSHHVLFRWGTG